MNAAEKLFEGSGHHVLVQEIDFLGFVRGHLFSGERDFENHAGAVVESSLYSSVPRGYVTQNS